MTDHKAQITRQGRTHLITTAPVVMDGAPSLFSVYIDGAPAQVLLAFEPFDGSFFCRQLKQRFADFCQAANKILDWLAPTPPAKSSPGKPKTTQNETWTPESIVSLLESDKRAVRRAILAIFNLQDERQRRGLSSGQNTGRGFSRYDRPMGNKLARKILERRQLTPKELDLALRLAIKYRRQLSELANQKTEATS